MTDEQQRMELDVSDILTLLKDGNLEVEGMMPYSSNHTLLTNITLNDLTTLAIYKPRRGERPLWDFPRGTLYRREVAAYLVSEGLGFSFVPPTVVRDGPYGVGAVQLFIENDQESHLFTMMREGGYDHTVLQLTAFDYLINNADRKSGHCLKGTDNRLWAIDHGICFHSEYKLRTVLWDYAGQPLPGDIRAALRNFQQCVEQRAPVMQVLEELLDAEEIEAMRRRLNRMVRTGVFPSPGAGGPNIPWPPV
ncbi:MAG: SCO1664 family protein [Chloroflexaceae bacterium]|nr:SCO1664 family protein [Chloroflexaceae bacterium]NJL33125.1 SCO1664 family protein [Chloroflexaceae bacterium]NJO05311.1 SCO1664 family protein [Chloroflexaceae bacterium]